MNTRSRSRSRPRDVRRHREDRVDRWQQPSAYEPGAGTSTLMRVRDVKPARSVSPDPPGPVKNTALVKNPFYRPNSSCAAEVGDQTGGLYMRTYAVQ